MRLSCGFMPYSAPFRQTAMSQTTTETGNTPATGAASVLNTVTTVANLVAPAVASTLENEGVPSAIAQVANEVDKANAYIAAVEQKIKTAETNPAVSAMAGLLKKWFPHETVLDEFL